MILLLLACTPGPIPDDAHPCASPEHWPLDLASAHLPLHVHHRPGEEATAAEVLALLETSWDAELALGFRPPLPDGDLCGPDDGFDVFLWDGLVESYVDTLGENPDTAWDDEHTYMVLDPWGPYGGEVLDATVAHELNHAMQATDDWWDSPIAFEMTSTFVEELVFPEDDGWLQQVADFQARPHWSLDHDDAYETWYMYGSALYLHYLRERWFSGDAAFVGQMWLGMRSAGGNEPDFEDALDILLREVDGDFPASVLDFARWRWDTGARADAVIPEVAVVEMVTALPHDVAVEVMALGSAYVAAPAAAVRVVDGDPAVTWVLQELDGAVVVTALPLPDDADPDDRTDTLYQATLRFEAPPG